MTYTINETHDPNLRSWVESANDPNTDFPIQNLPFCLFRPPRLARRRNERLPRAWRCDRRPNLRCISRRSWTIYSIPQPSERVITMLSSLNLLMGLDKEQWSELRATNKRAVE